MIGSTSPTPTPYHHLSMQVWVLLHIFGSRYLQLLFLSMWQLVYPVVAFIVNYKCKRHWNTKILWQFPDIPSQNWTLWHSMSFHKIIIITLVMMMTMKTPDKTWHYFECSAARTSQRQKQRELTYRWVGEGESVWLSHSSLKSWETMLCLRAENSCGGHRTQTAESATSTTALG